MFDSVFQITDRFIQRVFNELRHTARPFIQQTLDEVEPIVVSDDVSVQVVVNVPDDEIPVVLNPEDQTIELRVFDIPAQLKITAGLADEDILHDMIVSYLVSLPITSRETDSRVQVGSDPGSFDENIVLATLETGHPLADDQVLLGLLNRLVQDLAINGGLPSSLNFENVPLDNLPLEVSTFIRFINNNGDPAGPIVRMEPTGSSNRYMLIIPLEVWVNLEVAGTDVVLEHAQFEADLHVEMPVLRRFNPVNTQAAGFTVFISQGDAELVITHIVEGEEAFNDPTNRAALEAFVREQVTAILMEQGDQVIVSPSLDELIAILRDVMRNAITSDGRFLELWGSERSQETDTVTARILDDVLAIGINGSPGANLFSEEPFVPDDRDFAVRLNGDALLEEFDALLVAPDQYEDVEGTLRVGDQITFENQTEIQVVGFTAETGTVRANTRFRLNDFVYTVSVDTEIEDNATTFSFTPGLWNDAVTGDRVRIEFGVGLPLTEDAGGNDRTFRINDDLTASLEDGFIRLKGTGRLRRPHAIIRNIDAAIEMRLRLLWESTAKVAGGNQNGDTLDVDEVAPELRVFPDNSLVIVDDTREPYRLTNQAVVSDQSASLDLSLVLDETPDDNVFVSLRWLRIGQVSGAAQAGNTLRLRNMTEGEGLIPKGAVVKVGDKSFVIDADVSIEAGDRATLTLAKALSDELEDSPENDSNISLFSGWSGRATVDGADQTGKTLEISDIVRTLPGNTALTIAGMKGIFRTQSTVDIVDDQAEVTLSHDAIETLDDILDNVDPDELWVRLRQPQENVSVRRRSGGQSVALERVGDAKIELQTPLDGILGFIIGLVTALILPGGSLIRLLGGLAAGLLVRRLLRKALQDEANGLDINELVDLPIDDKLEGLGILLDAIFNNPIEITSDGITMAGTALVSSVFPDMAESRAQVFGPFTFVAGTIGQLSGTGPVPLTDQVWLSGNGVVLTGSTPSHNYPQHGFFIADYSVEDDRLGLVNRTRELSQVVVRNALPVLGALPLLSGMEGEEIVLEASFTDRAWLDTHRAIVDWGDDTLPTLTEITEILEPPQTSGTLVGRHTYCDNGEFNVTVILEDAQGGTARRDTVARVTNVPPKVDAGPDMFAHPCTPLRLVGHFTDQGWCDTHTGVWDFGDCTPLFPATITETHLPPEARGAAVATHCYKGCGTWQAVLTITDDDGASTSDSLTVTHSDLKNSDFEQGFERQSGGVVGRYWRGYAVGATSTVQSTQIFDCEECIVCRGQKSQAVQAPGHRIAGLSQSIGVNQGWEYQIAAMFQLDTPGTSGWIGIDPAGGDNRASDDVVWRKIGPASGWQGLSNRVVALGDNLTVYIEFRDPGDTPLIIDCVTLQAWPCTEKKDEPEDPSDDKPQGPPKGFCIHWKDQATTSQIPSGDVIAGLTFTSTSGLPLFIVTFGSPPGEGKLRIPDLDGPDALRIELNGPHGMVRARVSGPGQSEIALRAFGKTGALLASDTDSTGGIRELKLEALGIHRVQISSELRGTLLKFCATASTRPTAGEFWGHDT